MARTRKENTPTPRSVWQDQTVADNPDAPSLKKELAGLKWKRRALYTIAFGAVPGIFLMGAGMMAQASTPMAGDSTNTSVIVNGSKGKSEAFRALQEWIATDPSPLPGGKIVSWDGFTTEAPPAPTSENTVTPDYSFENHSFTVTRDNTMWRADVQVVVDDILGASVTAPPSLSPLPTVQVTASSPWFTLEQASPSTAVTQAVQAWAAAYTGGNSDALHQIVQDRDTDRSYIPLYGVDSLVGAEITAAGAAPLTDAAGTATDTIVVRVQLQFWWKGGKPAVGPDEQLPLPTPVAYDLLVEHADTATPVVVAWGAPGTGPTLKPYQNAVAAIVSDPKSGLGEDTPAAEPTTAPDETTGAGDAIEGEDN